MTDACGAGLCVDETPLSDTAEKRAEGFAGSGAPSSELRRRRKQRRAEKGREKPVLPTGCSRLLLHSCCAPCAGEIMERLLEAGIPYAVYFYNPNIHPKREYLIRKEENIRFCRRYGIEFIDADYDPQNWFALTKGQEEAPERGARCTTCFDMRLGKTAEYASQNGFDAIATSLGISRWKDLAQVDGCGFRVAEHYPGVTYWDFNWRRGGGAQRMLDLSKREGFYKQEYCGCSHSLRQTNAWRVANGRSPIVIGQEYYGEGAGRPEKKVGLVSVGEG